MAYSSYSPWRSEQSQEKQYRMTRGISQVVLKRLEKGIKKTYPKKIIKNKSGDEKDIGECCTYWHLEVLAFIGADEQKQKELIDEIRDAYYEGIYLDDDEDWLDEYAEATITFSKEQKEYAILPRLALKDPTEKQESKKEDVEDWYK